MIVKNDLYDYGLKIYQDTDYFKFSIDSILLAEIVKHKRGDKILDICTGSAPIPLILATKSKELKIDAVEIQPQVARLAKKSVAENKLENVINVYNQDIKTFKESNNYDIITCNPPYFKVTDSSLKNANDIKQIARHEISLTLKELILSVDKLIKSNGTFYIVHRVERFIETLNELEKYKFGIRNAIFVYTKNNSPAEFFLLEASKSKKTDLKVKSIYVENLKTYKNIFKER